MATFSQEVIMFSASIGSVPGGQITNSGFRAGTPMPFFVDMTVKNGYRFSEWEFSVAGSTGSSVLWAQLDSVKNMASFTCANNLTEDQAYWTEHVYATAKFEAIDPSDNTKYCSILLMASPLGYGEVSLNGGSFSGSVSIIAKQGDAYTAEARAKEGYIFKGWRSTNGASYRGKAFGELLRDTIVWIAEFEIEDSDASDYSDADTGLILRRDSSGVILRRQSNGIILRRGITA